MTSVRRTGAAHLRGGSMPASTRRDSALRRMRVARWSRRKRLARVSGTVSLVSASVFAEGVGDVAAEDGLFDGEVEGGVLDGVEGVGDVGDFVAGVDVDGG